MSNVLFDFVLFCVGGSLMPYMTEEKKISAFMTELTQSTMDQIDRFCLFMCTIDHKFKTNIFVF